MKQKEYSSKEIRWLILPLILAIILAVLSFSGCGEKAAGPEEAGATTSAVALSQPELGKLISDAALALVQASAYKVDLDMNMAAKASSGNETSQGVYTITIKGEIDQSARKSHVTVFISSNIEKSGNLSSYNETIEMYILPEWVYTKTEIPQWVKKPYTGEAAAMYLSAIEQQLELLKSATDLKFLKHETLDGSDCYVVEFTPDPVSIASWLLNYTILGISQDTSDKFSKTFKNLTCTAWIDKKTKLLKNMDIVLGITPENVSADINMTMKMYDYNQPVDITLPPETANAFQFPSGASPKQ